MKIPAKGFTHGGKFHADDVFATALLMIVRPDIKVTRGFVVPDGFDGIVYDVGCGMFDHHQEPRESRPNGVPYAAFGLLWRVLGAQLVGAHQARLLDENFVQPLDLNDNTGEQNSLADAIGSFNPVWDSGEDSDACFWRAVPFAKQVLENEIAAANAVNRADETVQNAYKNSKDGIVVLPDYMPWKNGLYKTDALFVVYPSQRGGYSAQCVTDYKTRRSKVPFPPAWGGQPEEILREKSGLALKFCHPSRFLVTAETKEDAIEACRRALRAAGRLVDHDFRIRQSEALALRAAGKQERSHAGRHTHTDRGYITLDILHRVIDRHTGRYRTARAVDIKLNILAGIFRFQEKQLRYNQTRGHIIHFFSQKDDAILQKTGINIVGALSAAGGFQDIGD